MQNLLLALGVILLPVYTFDSGTVQFSHAILALFALVTLLQVRITLAPADVLLIVLSTYVTAREAVAVMADPATISAMLAALYMFFNTMIVIAIARYPISEGHAQTSLRRAITLSVAVAFLGLLYFGANFTYGGAGFYRSDGTFNNPNQLAYFGICTGSLAALLLLRGIISRLLFGAILAGAVFMVAASASRAAAVAVVPLIVFGVATWISTRRTPATVWLAALVAFAVVTLLVLGGFLDQFDAVDRLRTSGSGANDRLENRGYQWYLETPLEFVFGLGQTSTAAHVIGDNEVHSTIWSFMITYGVIGFILFVALMIVWAKRVYSDFGLLGVMLVVFPPMLYGITHNGTRFTAFWLLVGLSLTVFPRLVPARRHWAKAAGPARDPILAGFPRAAEGADENSPGKGFRAWPAS